jgi:TolB-like protein
VNRFARIRERKLVQWLLAYLATAWLLLEVIGFLAEQFDWPTIVPRSITLLLGVGILGVLVLAWYHGEQGRQRVNATELLMLTGIFIIGASSVAMVRGAPAPRQPSAAEAGTIAVLPFANVSSDTDNEYYSDGLTEELISALARVEGVRVAARTSVFAFKNQGGDVREIGRQLNVSAVLEGSVRKAGDMIRINAHLINVADGYSLWSGSYERELTDVFALQDEIARSIVAALPGISAVHQSGMLVEATTADPEAYNAYLQGRYYWNNRGVTHADYFQLACDRFSAAVARDSLFAPGWAGLADCYYLSYGGRDGDMARARDAARRALELDPRLSSPHSALGQTYVAEGAWDRAEREHRAAIALNPGDALAFQRYALMLSWAGRHEEALVMIRRAQSLDPVSIVVLRDLAAVLLRRGRYDESIRVAEEAQQIQSTFPAPAQPMS